MIDQDYMDKKVNEWVDDAIYREDKPRIEGRFYCSEMGMCPRKMVLSRLYPKPISKELRRIFELGNIIHDFVEKVFKNAKGVRLLDSERSLILTKPGSPVVLAGRLDDFILMEEADQEMIIEVKSIKSFKYLSQAKPEHIMQIMPYLKAMNLKKGALVYVQKTDLAVKSFLVEYDEDVVVKVFDKAEMVYNHLKNGTLPEKVNLKDRWMCNYCEHKEECENGDSKEVHSTLQDFA